VGNPPPSRAAEGGPRLATLVGLTVLYFIAGKLSLTLALVHASTSAVWPPTGIALAALLILGHRAWPAIFVGAFLVNITTAGGVLTSVGIATGNTLEAIVGAWLVQTFCGGGRVFERALYIFKFTILVGLGSTAISATCGVASLWLGGLAGPDDHGSIWLTWWLGDLGGDLVVAPLVYLWATRPWPRWEPLRMLEAAALLVSLLGVGFVVFGGVLQGDMRSLSFLSLPVLLWAAFRFNQREAATATALLSGIAVWGCLRGAGPFANTNESLVLLQAFMGVIGITTLAVAATVSQRRKAEEALLRTAAIVASSEDAIIGENLDGTIVSWNPGAERLYGYSAAEVLGRKSAILVPVDRPDETPLIFDRLRRGERVEHYETVRMRRDGRTVMVSLTVSPIRGPKGRLYGISAIARDVTQRKRTEQRFGTQFAITRVLAESASLREVAPRILRALCEGLGWDVGEIWRVTASEHAMRLEAAWPDSGGGGAPGSDAPKGQEIIPAGQAIAGRAWDSGQPVCLEDISAGGGESGSEVAVGNFHGAEAWPVRIGMEVAAVVVLFSRRRRAQRQELRDLMSDIVARIGQFLERERAVEGLRALRKAVETIRMGVTVTDVRGRILYTNPADAAMHGYRPDELIGKDASVFVPPDATPVEGQPPIESWRGETVNIRRDGTVFPVQQLSDAVRAPDGTPVAVVTCTEEITERKRSEEALRSSEERYRLLFERNLAGVYRATIRGRLLECNGAFAHILGYSSREEVLAHDLSDLFFTRQDRDVQIAQLRERGALTNMELRLRRKDGGTIWVLENETLLSGPGGEELVEGTMIDITDRKEFEQRIEFHAFHDPLTGLPNRTSLKERLQALLAEARWSGRGLALLFMDLDQFKIVNDTLGHSVGDRLLQQVAGRLRECLREDDMVARVGGDEFVLLLPHVHHEASAGIARKILARMEEPFHLDGHELSVTTSIGIAVFPDDADNAEILLKNADSAMYRAKEMGRNAFQLWDPAAKPPAGERLETRSRLRRAMERGELAIFYQPLVELATGRKVGAEALLRWRHPERGIVLPREFVPVAEESGLIVSLGEWVLRNACASAKGWQERGLPLRVSVNVSVRQFQQPGFRSTVEAILQETSLPPRLLELEITETVAMQNFDLAVPALRDFVAMGIGVCIDDLGTGYSSLSYLKLLPIRRLKIDRSFIVGIGREAQDRAIVKAIVRMGHSLGVGVVAEGVETGEQIAVLKELRCDECQGWIFGEAVPEDELEKLAARTEVPGAASRV
jgi:diguanylate cyclase (GGDEF)-like protein/PAS domain S-box-containing protein